MDELSAEIPLSKIYQPSKLALYLTDQSQGDHNGHSWQILFEAKVINDYWLENKHDYIQWWFPLDEPSRAKSFLPYLSAEDVSWMRQQAIVANSQNFLLARMKKFLMENDYWICHYNHNHLRITRMIKSLRLLQSDKSAEELKEWLSNYLGDNIRKIDKKAVQFWWKS